MNLGAGRLASSFRFWAFGFRFQGFGYGFYFFGFWILRFGLSSIFWVFGLCLGLGFRVMDPGPQVFGLWSWFLVNGKGRGVRDQGMTVRSNGWRGRLRGLRYIVQSLKSGPSLRVGARGDEKSVRLESTTGYPGKHRYRIQEFWIRVEGYIQGYGFCI